MQKSVLNKQINFGVKILWRYTDMAIFVLRCFILTHPVDLEKGHAKNKREKEYFSFLKQTRLWEKTLRSNSVINIRVTINASCNSNCAKTHSAVQIVFVQFKSNQ